MLYEILFISAKQANPIYALHSVLYVIGDDEKPAK
jgi:hypothetical protein